MTDPRRDVAERLTKVASMAGWLIEHGAKGEVLDLCDEVLELRLALLREPSEGREPGAFDVVFKELRRLAELTTFDWERENLYLAAGIVRRAKSHGTPSDSPTGEPDPTVCPDCYHPMEVQHVCEHCGHRVAASDSPAGEP